jgi:dihydroflavonol-4-reductase
MKTAFVTGGTGFVGQHVVEQAKAAGYDVIVFHRAGSNTRRLAQYAPTFAEGSLDSVDSIASAMPEGCEAVFHVAGNTSFWSRDREKLERDNVAGTRHMVEAALRRNAKQFVCTSSESAWGDPGDNHSTRPCANAATIRSSTMTARSSSLRSRCVAVSIAACMR